MKFDLGYLHIGTEKTGTTSLQQFFALNRRRLAKHGIFYPATLGETAHIKLFVHALEFEKVDQFRGIHGVQTVDQLEEFRSGLVNELAAEIEKRAPAEGSVIVFSDEHLHKRIDETAEFERLRDFCLQLCERLKIVV